MNKTCLSGFVLTVCAGIISSVSTAATQPVFSPEQEARIGEIAADYMLAHPDVLVQVSEKLQMQQRERQQHIFAVKVMENQDALVNDPDTPAAGPKDAHVAVIEFFDYQCVHCSHMAPVLDDVMKRRPSVKYIFKEWPIFAGSYKASLQAAERGLSVWKAKGADAYLTYHNTLYHTDHIEGALTENDINQATVAAVGNKVVRDESSDAALENNYTLARSLGLTGTPGLIVMPLENAAPKNITVIPGSVSAEVLLAAIDKAGQ
ncbi:DsbA family protein [Scandinavium sp. NPDC088450]|uniref:DsbA family protein n=1 Tax=Scandinavium sp. NPDC088450 TaxID=3364514 RepID=UPI00384F8ABE